jgi:hypothetical protein
MRLRLIPLLLAVVFTMAAADQPVHFLDLHAHVPDAWLPEPVASRMRVLQFRVPGGAEGGDAELIVDFFGPGQGGSLEANVARWKSPFSAPNGGEVQPVITRLSGGLPATRVALEGRYARGIGIGPGAQALSSRMLLAALVETPRGTLYPQLHGPAATVKAARQDFIAFIEAITADD